MNELRPENLRRILIRATNWIGDAVMSVPALREIRRIFPEARITLLARPWVKDVYGAVDFVDEVREFDKTGRHSGLSGLQRMAAELRSEKYDAAILLQNAVEAAILVFLAGIPIRAGYPTDARGLLLTHKVPLNPAVRTIHQAYYYLGILSGLGLLPGPVWMESAYELDIRIGVKPADMQTACSKLEAQGIPADQQLIGVNPGAAYGPAKRWFSERYAAVADALAERMSATVVIFGSEAELPIAREVASAMRSKAVILAGRTSLGELMALLRRCALLITNDSGPMHLAAALSVPQVAIFGSSSERATGPLSRIARVATNPVDCSPCFLRECPIDLRCMRGVSVESVIREATDLLELSRE